VWAWTHHESGAEAFFEDVITIAEGIENVPYFVVRRKIGGEWVRYIERLHTRSFETIDDAFFVDCGLSYEGPPADEFFIPHLAGQEVVALADGNVVRNLIADPDTGKVTLPNEARK